MTALKVWDGSAWVTVGGGGAASRGADASRPAAGNAGTLYLPTDGMAIHEDNGTSWQRWGPIFPFTDLPAIGTLSTTVLGWINQGSAVATAINGRIELDLPSTSGTNWRMLMLTAPATPYTLTVALLWNGRTGGNWQGGLVFRQSSDGKLATASQLGTGTLEIQKWSGPSTFSANYTNMSGNTAPRLHWMQLSDDGTNRIIRQSTDGKNFYLLHSVGRTDFLTADQIGFGASVDNSSAAGGITVLSWKIT